MRDHFIKRLCELALKDKRILLITGDLGFVVFDRYRQECPDQFINAGVAEQNMTSMATGMALQGKIVFTYSIGNFPTLRCLEQIRNDACYHGANVKIIAVGGGFSYGSLGISHHATEDIAILRALPDLTVVSPCGLWEAEEMTEAVAYHPGTCYMRLDKSFGNAIPAPGEKLKIGKARKLRDGNDCSFIVCGGILEEVEKAADMLNANGIKSGIYSLHTISPLDKEAIYEAALSSAVVTVEEHTISGGLGSAVAETLMDAGIHPSRFLRIGLNACFSSIVGSQHYLRERYGLSASKITARVSELLNRSLQ